MERIKTIVFGYFPSLAMKTMIGKKMND